MYRYTNISFPSLGIDIDPIREFSLMTSTPSVAPLL